KKRLCNRWGGHDLFGISKPLTYLYGDDSSVGGLCGKGIKERKLVKWDSDMSINRRDALKNMVLMMGGTMVGANVILTGCAPEDRIEGLDFKEEDIAFLDE